MADTVVLMKNRVLDMAMRGELVDQRPEEGSAEELILSFKKENKLKEINKDEIPYTIPQSWLWVDFESIIKSIGTKNNQIKSKEIENTGTIPVVSQGKEYIDGFSNQVDKSISPKKPVILFGDHTRNVKYIDFEFIIGADGTKIFESLLADSKYLFRWVQRASTFIENRGYSRHYSLLKKKPVPIPPLAEQKRIVAKIEEIFAVIDQIGTKKEEALTIIQNMRQTALQDAIMGVLVEQDETDEPASELYEKIKNEKEFFIKSGKNNQEKLLPEIDLEEITFEIPNNWKWVRLGEVGQTNIGLTYKPTDKSEDGTIVLRSSNIQNGKMDYSDIVRVDLNIPEAKKCEIGDLLICARNGSKRLVGKAALVDEEGHSFGAFMANYRSEFNQYIYYYMRSNFFRSLLGESGTTTINQITQSMLKGFILPLPPFAEQERIVRKLDEIMTICDQMEAILD
ncbi:restriction endonuclease subunit S [Carnobacterium divergens]